MPLKSITRTVIAVLAAAISLAASNRKFDVVVYGGTAGGVATAVAAARQGMTVALLDPGPPSRRHGFRRTGVDGFGQEGNTVRGSNR